LVIEAIKSAKKAKKKAQEKHKRKRKESAHHLKRSLSPKSLSPFFII